MAHVREGVAERAPDAASQPSLGVVLRVQLALLWVACLAEKTVQAEACRVSQLLDEAHVEYGAAEKSFRDSCPENPMDRGAWQATQSMGSQ